MAKKTIKGGGAGFFKPRSTTLRSNPDYEEEDLITPQAEGFSKGELAILAALEKNTTRLAKVESAVQSLEKTLEGIDARVKQVQNKTEVLELKLASLDPRLTSLQDAQSDFGAFKDKAIQAFILMDDFKEKLENEKRCAVIRILGLEGKRDGEDLLAEAGDFLSSKVNPHDDDSPVEVQKAYRLKTRRGAEGEGQVGTILATLKNGEERELLLAKAAKIGNLIHEERKILIFPDVGQATLARRKELLDLRKKFLVKGAQASLWAPA